MIFLYKYWFCIYLRTRANTRAQVVLATTFALFRPQKTYFLLSKGSKSLIITFFLFTELDSIKNITMLKKLPDHFQYRLFHYICSQKKIVENVFHHKIMHKICILIWLKTDMSFTDEDSSLDSKYLKNEFKET